MAQSIESENVTPEEPVEIRPDNGAVRALLAQLARAMTTGDGDAAAAGEAIAKPAPSVSLAPAAGVDHVTSGFAGLCGLHFWIGFQEFGVEHHSAHYKTPDAADFFGESCPPANLIVSRPI